MLCLQHVHGALHPHSTSKSLHCRPVGGARGVRHRALCGGQLHAHQQQEWLPHGAAPACCLVWIWSHQMSSFLVVQRRSCCAALHHTCNNCSRRSLHPRSVALNATPLDSPSRDAMLPYCHSSTRHPSRICFNPTSSIAGHHPPGEGGWPGPRRQRQLRPAVALRAPPRARPHGRRALSLLPLSMPCGIPDRDTKSKVAQQMSTQAGRWTAKATSAMPTKLPMGCPSPCHQHSSVL